MAAAFVATTIMTVPAAPVAAADVIEVGGDCAPAQIGQDATASDGTSVRCMIDEQGAIHWLSGTEAVTTIAGLQAQGYTLTLDRVGDAPIEACRVIEVHNPIITTERAGSGGSAPGGAGSSGNRHATTIVLTKRIDVSLDCT